MVKTFSCCCQCSFFFFSNSSWLQGATRPGERAQKYDTLNEKCNPNNRPVHRPGSACTVRPLVRSGDESLWHKTKFTTNKRQMKMKLCLLDAS